MCSLNADFYLNDTKKSITRYKHLWEIFKILPPTIGVNFELFIAESVKFIENLILTFINEKRNQHDFIIWETGHQGEIIWPSPWGYRHPISSIQSSVMATVVLDMNIFHRLRISNLRLSD
jgi:cysteinyl-tRNA synthetase